VTRLLLLLILAAIGVLGGVAVVDAASGGASIARSSCTRHATSGSDHLCGGRHADRLSGGRGNDRISGGRGRDRLSGGRGNDRLDGGRGRDRLLGGPGSDLIRARDGYRDIVDCGGGSDFALVDHGDRVARNCEHVSRLGRASS
jgi:Ca2+-binding RTX toxin-like protein